MASYVIVTDSTADLPYSFYKEHDISVIPMEFVLNDIPYHHYADAREMGYEEFYEKVSSGADVHTSQVQYVAYEEMFRPILEQGKDILYICFTSGLSGTYQTSLMAAWDLMEEYPDRKIVSIDSRCASIGQGFLVHEAVLEMEKGRTMEEMEAWVNDHRLKIRHWFVVDNLDQLRKGGRISAAAAVVGSALNIKPLLSVNAEGKLITAAKLRGERKILETFCQKIRQDGDHTEDRTILIGHAANKLMAEKLKMELISRGIVKDAMIADIGPVIGAHVGKGMYAMVYMSDRDLEV